MPDGTPVNFPDDMPHEQIRGMIASKYPDAVQEHENPPVHQGLFDRIKKDYEARVVEGQQAADAYVAGDQGTAMTGLDFAGKIGAGTAADAIAETAKSAYSYAPEGVKDAVSSGVSAITSLPTNDPRAPTVGDAAGLLGSKYEDFKKRYPDAARHVEAAVNIGSLLAPEIPVKGKTLANTTMEAPAKAKSLVKSIPQSMQVVADDAAKQVAVKNEREMQTEALRKSAGNLYKQSAQEGITFGEGDIENMSLALAKLKPKTDLEARSWNNSGAAKQIADIQESFQAELPTLEGMIAKRAEINSLIKVATRSGNDAEAYKLNRVKDAMDETMMNDKTSTWQLANHQWAQQATLDDMDEIVNKALSRAQPANSLDTAINNYLTGYKGRGLSDKEWQALKEVTNNSSVDKLRKGAASGLLKFTTGAIGATGGPVGAGAGYLMGHYGSEFLKDSAMAAKVAKLDRFREMVMSREMKSAAKP